MKSLISILVLVVLAACTARARVSSGPGPSGPPPTAGPPPAGPPPAAGDWEKLGEKIVNGGGDRDVIGGIGHEGKFRAIKIVVEDAPIEIWNINVVFGNQENFSPTVRQRFGAGSTSRTIDLPGQARLIRRVEFAYGNLTRGSNATVSVWGMR